MVRTLSRLSFAVGLLAVVLMADRALAHPHVLPTVRADLVFTTDGRVEAIRYVWVYDTAYSTFVGRDIDANKDGVVSDDELSAFAKQQIDGLQERNYFTTVMTKTGDVELNSNPSYQMKKLDDGRLQIDLVLTLKKPAPVDAKFVVELYDPEIFAYFTMANDGVHLVNAPQGCTPAVTGPQPIDLRNTRSIPQVFWDALNYGSKTAALQLVNRIKVECP